MSCQIANVNTELTVTASLLTNTYYMQHQTLQC